MLQTYMVPRDPQSLFYTIIVSFLQKRVPNKIKKQWFYPIKHFSGIVATPTYLYFVVTKCKEGGIFIRLC